MTPLLPDKKRLVPERPSRLNISHLEGTNRLENGLQSAILTRKTSLENLPRGSAATPIKVVDLSIVDIGKQALMWGGIDVGAGL